MAKRYSNLKDTLVHSEFVKTANINWLMDLPELKGDVPIVLYVDMLIALRCLLTLMA